MTVINPPDWKLANHTFVHCSVTKTVKCTLFIEHERIAELAVSNTSNCLKWHGFSRITLPLKTTLITKT